MSNLNSTRLQVIKDNKEVKKYLKLTGKTFEQLQDSGVVNFLPGDEFTITGWQRVERNISGKTRTWFVITTAENVNIRLQDLNDVLKISNTSAFKTKGSFPNEEDVKDSVDSTLKTKKTKNIVAKVAADFSWDKVFRPQEKSIASLLQALEDGKYTGKTLRCLGKAVLPWTASKDVDNDFISYKEGYNRATSYRLWQLKEPATPAVPTSASADLAKKKK